VDLGASVSRSEADECFAHHALRLNQHWVETKRTERITTIRAAHSPAAVAFAGPMEDTVATRPQDTTIWRLRKPYFANTNRTERPACGVLGKMVVFTIVAVPELLAPVDVPRENQAVRVKLVAG
jgi:hypothetical protein